MRKLFLFLPFFALTGISLVCKGQYTGGNEDGSSYTAYTGTVCTASVNANIYFGGVSNISSDAAFSASVCAAPVNANIYFGGVQDGFSQNALTVTVCPAQPNSSIYFGGVQDGSSSAALNVSVCPVPMNGNIYFGGVEDGSSEGGLTVSVCPAQPNSNIYFGGVQDGFSYGSLVVSVCPAQANSNIYFGGVQDGLSSVYLKTLLASCLLPIELASFTGSCLNGNGVLNWTTANEDNNAYFTIEYSSDGISWQEIGSLPGAGNSSTLLNYSFTDGTPRSGSAYYRLKQTDRDGKFTYSTVIAIGGCMEAGVGKMNIYPNPTAGLLLLSYDGDRTKVQSIEVFNVLGERVYYSGVWQSSIDLSEKAAGTYFIHFTSDKGTEIKEVVLKRY